MRTPRLARTVRHRWRHWLRCAAVALLDGLASSALFWMPMPVPVPASASAPAWMPLPLTMAGPPPRPPEDPDGRPGQPHARHPEHAAAHIAPTAQERQLWRQLGERL